MPSSLGCLQGDGINIYGGSIMIVPRSIARQYVIYGPTTPKPILVSGNGHPEYFPSLTQAARALTLFIRSFGSNRKIRWWQLEHAATIGQPLSDPDLGDLTVLFAHKRGTKNE
jgi:hypothetical protein